MVDGMAPILVSMAGIFAIAVIFVVVVAIRAVRGHEGTARQRIRRRREQRRAHAAGKPTLFVEASRRQRHGHAGDRHDRASGAAPGRGR